MTKGIIALLILWVFLIIKAFQYPWIGIIGYAGFAVLCPTWNWRWGLPEIEYQKFLSAATLLGWLLIGLRRQSLTAPVVRVLWASGLYLLLAWISSIQSLNPTKSAFYLDISWKIALMCAVGIFVLNQPRYLTILAWVLVLAQGWNAFNINQLYYERGYIVINNFSWNFLDNNTYSISTLPVMAITFAILMTAQKQWHRLLSGFIFVLQLHQLMILQSRGTMLGGLVLLAAGVVFMPKNRVTWGLVTISLIVGSILAGPSVIEEFSSSFKAEEELDSSAKGRYLLWKAGIAIMRDYPLLGVGPWAGELVVPWYYEGDLGGMTTKALHNLFFEVGTGCGIPALLCYLAIFGIPWLSHLRIWLTARSFLPLWMKAINLSILCGVPGYWGASMFSSGALIETPYLLVLLGCAALPVYRVEQMRQAEELEHSEVTAGRTEMLDTVS